ncbi:uncharacterized protein BP5553_00635 [Venustampulla echinocandica]|uniref:Stc1 domain-containing protein n=1 Tax=Venustampulla echinocandica TaxID=2656787 RepID=A0A370TYP8_9HELO|nr:uncharacterized protein BP5553_00635 [Venustampulla echinocandica]RDL40656.1 hypothetical protein BP5553_00635 [Venustampulla echinocandica]
MPFQARDRAVPPHPPLKRSERMIERMAERPETSFNPKGGDNRSPSVHFNGYATQCYLTTGVFSCKHKVPLKDGKITHAGKCRSTNHETPCGNMAMRNKEWYFSRLCALCAVDAKARYAGSFEEFMRDVKGGKMMITKDTQSTTANMAEEESNELAWEKAAASLMEPKVKSPVQEKLPPPSSAIRAQAQEKTENLDVASSTALNTKIYNDYPQKTVQESFHRNITKKDNDSFGTAGEQTYKYSKDAMDTVLWESYRKIWMSMPSADNGAADPEPASSHTSSVLGGVCKALTPKYVPDSQLPLEGEEGELVEKPDRDCDDGGEDGEGWVNIAGGAEAAEWV